MTGRVSGKKAQGGVTMGFLSGLLGVLALVFFCAGVAGLIRPGWFKNQKTGEVPTRARMGRGGLLMAALLLMIAVIVAPDDKAAPTKIEAAAAKPAVPKPNPKNAVKADFKKLWSSMRDVDALCSSSMEDYSKEATSGKINPYKLADLARTVGTLCADSSDKIGALSVPTSIRDTDQRSAISDMLKMCGDADSMRAIAVSRSLDIIDGDMSPSTVSLVKQQFDDAKVSAIGCAVKTLQAASSSGLSLEEMKEMSGSPDS